jgi:sortase A
MKPYGHIYRKRIPPNPAVVSKTKKLKRLLGPVLITLGSIMVTNVVWPIVQHQLIHAPKMKRRELVAPISQETIDNLRANPSREVATLQPPTQASPVSGAEPDYSKVSTWFPGATQQSVSEKPTSYSLSIPSLNIENAQVLVGGEDLNQSLIHYAGTAHPGELGSPVIFGHSILRQFYNPAEKNKDRYRSIFSKIMTLKTGERIYVDYDGIQYTYEVKDKVEVSPEDLFILEQRYTNRELKLITCVPEGTYLRRGVVVAQLVDLTR